MEVESLATCALKHRQELKFQLKLTEIVEAISLKAIIAVCGLIGDHFSLVTLRGQCMTVDVHLDIP